MRINVKVYFQLYLWAVVKKREKEFEKWVLQADRETKRQVAIYIYIYIYIERERETETETEIEREKEREREQFSVIVLARACSWFHFHGFMTPSWTSPKVSVEIFSQIHLVVASVQLSIFWFSIPGPHSLLFHLGFLQPIRIPRRFATDNVSIFNPGVRSYPGLDVG